MLGRFRAVAVNFILFLCLYLGFSAALFAGGSKEDSISTARQYIVEKKYDAALAVLADVIKTDSSRFDEAYSLVQQVQLIKGDYYKYLEDLINILTTDPGNYQKALDAINKMTVLDPNPSERNRQKIEDFRIVAKIAKDRNDKNLLMAKALAQIQQKDYTAAIDTYLSGFDLQKDDFLIGTQTPEFRSAVQDLVAQIKSAVKVHKTENAKLMPGLEKFTQDIQQGAEGLDRVAAALPVFSGQFLVTINQTVRIEKAGSDAVALRVRSDKDYPPSDKRNYTYNEYVRFIQEFMQGPPGKTGQGIAYAARTLVDNEYADTLARLDELYSTRKQGLATILASATTKDLSPSFTAISLAGNILMRAYGLKGSVDLGNKPSFADLTAKLPESYRVIPAAILFELHAYDQLEFDLKQKAIWENLNAKTSATVWQESLAALDTLRASYDKWTAETQAIQDAKLIDRATFEKGRSVFVPTMTTVQDGLLTLARNRFSTITANQLEDVKGPFLASTSEEKRSLDLLNGASSANPNGALPTKVIYRFPDLALASFATLRAKYQDYLKGLDNLDNSIKSGRVEVREYAPVQTTAKSSVNLRKDINDALARLDVEISRAQANIKTAQERIARAAIALNAAEAAVSGNRLEVDVADKFFNDASDLYFQAFDIAYNKDQRTQVDTKLQALRIKIDDARNLMLVQKKREAIRGAQDSLNREQNQRAFENISQAEKYDIQTVDYQQKLKDAISANDALDPEIVYWKSRILAANALSSERTISEADPVFFSLSNYLNLAQMDYSKASRLVVSGNKAEGLRLLDHAGENINNVLLVKPNNKDAKFLRLQVERIRDPVLFDQLFPNRIRDAINQAQKAPTTNSLTDLYAFRDIKPGNAELEQAIGELRVKLGLDPSPLTKARRAEAAGLVAQARPLVKSPRQSDIRQGLKFLEQALRLDPTSADAGAVADQARIRLRDVPDSLSFEEQQSFNRANELLNTDNVGNAAIIANDLLKTHPTYGPLLKLIQKINLKLGQ